MPAYLVCYTLKKQKNYPLLWNALKGWNMVRVLDSTWVGTLVGPAATIRDLLLNYVDADDDIVVIELKPGMQWASRASRTNPGVAYLVRNFPSYP